jgi:hypothetical protein
MRTTEVETAPFGVTLPVEHRANTPVPQWRRVPDRRLVTRVLSARSAWNLLPGGGRRSVVRCGRLGRWPATDAPIGARPSGSSRRSSGAVFCGVIAGEEPTPIADSVGLELPVVSHPRAAGDFDVHGSRHARTTAPSARNDRTVAGWLRRRIGVGTTPRCAAPRPDAGLVRTVRTCPGTSKQPRRTAVRTGRASRSAPAPAG